MRITPGNKKWDKKPNENCLLKRCVAFTLHQILLVIQSSRMSSVGLRYQELATHTLIKLHGIELLLVMTHTVDAFMCFM
jgi:hypothetical protein